MARAPVRGAAIGGLLALLLTAPASAGVATAARSGGADAIVPARASSSLPAVAGAMASGGPSIIESYRRLERGTLPKHSILAATTPSPLATGVSVTLFTADVDGDGVQELAQVRGTASNPKIAVTDGGTGVPRWTYATGTTFFSVFPVPDASGAADLLVFDGASWRVRVLDGATGTILWTRSLPDADFVGYWGVSAAPGGGDIVIGGYHTDAPLVNRLDIEFHSLATGAPTGTYELRGEGDYPSAALAGDLDGDGVGDLFAYTPIDTYSAGAAGLLSAVGARGATTTWTVPVAMPVTDFVWLTPSADITGDGKLDPALLAEWDDPTSGLPARDTVNVFDGNGPGGPAGSITQVDLNQIAQAVVVGGDAAGRDLIFSGAMYNLTDGYGFVDFEAIGRGGRVWESRPSYGTSYANFGAAWWPDARDLNGDGLADALIDLGSAEIGYDRVVAVDQRGGAALWTQDATAGAFAIPALADLSGDGGADVLSGLTVSHPASTQTRFSFGAVNGSSGASLWSHERLLAAGGQTWSLYAMGGRFDASGQQDVVVEYDLGGSGRHLAERLHGPDGTVIWQDPA
ncbi:MAG: hypothetical protein ABR600_03035 [Actinomycetota bacterium]